MSTKDNQKVYFGDKKVSKEIKKDGVETIFTKVSENYDLMNDFMSAGMHRVWKRSFIDSANINKDDVCLDLAAGTGDIAKLIAKKVKEKSIYLCDQNLEMIEKAKERSLNEGFYHKCFFAVSSAEKLPYDDETFNHVFISFGFRNFSDKKNSLKEIYRVLKKGGKLHILEFSKAQGQNFSKLYDFYSYNFIPKIGDLISGDRESYEYLVKSIRTHENQEEMLELFKDTGFSNCNYENIFKGIVALHRGLK
ncbi:MAG: bifunctional demethylmenaquinone methyltransferase/2-methoxy-6-polyprenyl-1,4-benzoquinol methylase [Gammaproteobacteria bacterium]|nr:bifunctional demethylmenaquinone methyltransferase/2-methoxy-6-polyprenyl-1,4-benzoquinol methylase [Gammaproteobacteria bacterium]